MKKEKRERRKINANNNKEQIKNIYKERENVHK